MKKYKILNDNDLCYFYLRCLYSEIKTREEFEKYQIKNMYYRKLARNVFLFCDRNKDEVFIVEIGKKETIIYKSKNLEVYGNDNDSIYYDNN